MRRDPIRPPLVQGHPGHCHCPECIAAIRDKLMAMEAGYEAKRLERAAKAKADLEEAIRERQR